MCTIQLAHLFLHRFEINDTLVTLDPSRFRFIIIIPSTSACLEQSDIWQRIITHTETRKQDGRAGN